MHKGFKFDNNYELVVRAGDTHEILHEVKGHNDISDDFLCGHGKVFVNSLGSTAAPWGFILPDGAAWSGGQWLAQGSVFNRQDPWAPYCTTANNLGDTGADGQYSGCSLTVPYGVGNASPNKWKLFYRWSLLPVNFTLRAFGLTGWQDNVTNFVFGVVSTGQQGTFVPQTLVVLPAGVLVRGRNPSIANNTPTQTPDILEITYYLSILGA